MPTRCIALSHVARFAGLVSCALTGLIFAYYMYILHETRLWFSNIRPVEREISFRTESGLYYSYYKQIVGERTWAHVWTNLTRDYLTEAPDAVNLLERMNIYQEVLLALLYMFTSLFYSIDSILFYTYSCFALAGFNVATVFGLSWRLSGSFMFGLLTACWTFADVDDATRVFFTVNLRENFALPFFWIHNLCVVHYLSCTRSFEKESFKWPLALSMFFFSLFWQFNQFILLLESVSLLGVALVFPEKTSTVISIFKHQIATFLCLMVAQFFQKMLVGSVFIWLNAVSVLVLSLKPPMTGRWKRSVAICGVILILTGILSSGIKMALQIEADSHIWTFVKAKLKLPLGEIPFETALYVCHGAFAFIDTGFFERSSKYGMFPLYCICCLVTLGLALRKVLFVKPDERKCEDESKMSRKRSKTGDEEAEEEEDTHAFLEPGLLFVVIESVLIGIMACLTLRMKYVWFPLVAVTAAHLFKACDKLAGKYPKYAVVLGICYLAMSNQYNVYQQQTANEQEFYDPDTVQLMEWVLSETPQQAIFAGSMQLMAGVKLCTGRPISNHPHFEDKKLRQKTELIYQVYGRYHVAHVAATLCGLSVNYLILEDSICLSQSKDGCSTNEIMDAVQARDKGVDPSKERFCSAVKQQSAEIEKQLQLVFENRTFRVYQIHCVDTDG